MRLLLACSVACVASVALSARAGALQIQLDELQKLPPTNPVGADKHGQSIALDGDRLLIGAPETTTTGSGRVYAYSRSAGTWTLDQKLSFFLGGPGSSFGRRIAIDGDSAVISNLTSAFVFKHNGSAWALQSWIASPGNISFYGAAVDIDGDTAAIGQPSMTENQVWIWARSGTTWSLQQKLEPPNPPQTIGFGEAVALVGDTVIIGAPRDGQAASNAGAVFVFTRSGTQWTQQAKLFGAPAFPLRRLGRALDAQPRPGGSIEFVVGAAGSASGEVLVFEGNGASWIQTARIQPTTGGGNGWFGSSVRIDGDLMVVGAWLGDASAPDTGLATVYRRCGGGWVRQADLLGSDTVSFDNFGLAADIQGETVVVGAPSHDLVGQDAGSSYVFELSDSPLSLYCPGDGSGSACPCGNELPPGTSGGCANSSGLGALLVLDDSIQASPDNLRAYACGLIAAEPALLFAGLARVGGGAGGPFGDGLRCAGGGVARLGTAIADPVGAATWGPGLGALGGWSAGDTRHFQVWYRDPSGGPCDAGFNLSNGVSVLFAP